MKRFENINVIPFIDIMLVLLAIVLTTATFIVEGKLDIRLPESKSQAKLDQPDRRELAIHENETLYLDSEPVARPCRSDASSRWLICSRPPTSGGSPS